MTELKYLGIDEETLAAKNYLASLPSLPLTYTEDEKNFIDELNAVVNILRKNPAVWLCVQDLPHEIWRDVKNYEGLYQVSNYGRVKSFYYANGKILSGGFDTGRYSMMHINKGKHSKTILLHKIVLGALEWATRQENMQHAAKMGLIRNGEDNGKAKITNEQVKFNSMQKC